MDNNKEKYTCPKCGGHKFSVYNKDSFRNTLLICTQCGNEGSEYALRTKMTTSAQSIADKGKELSDQANVDNDPTIFKLKNINKRYRKDPKERLMSNDTEEVRSISMRNPFIKESIFGFGKNFKDIFEEKTQIPYSVVRKIIFDNIHEYLNKKIIETGKMVPNGPKIHEIMSKRVDSIIQKALMISGINIEISFDEGKKEIFFNNLKQITMENMEEITEGIFPKLPDGDVGPMAKKNPFLKESKLYRSINPFLKESQSNEGTDDLKCTDENIDWENRQDDLKQSSKNPFLKEAREYRRSPRGEMAKMDSEKNMTYPEGIQVSKDVEDKKDDEDSNNQKSRVMPKTDFYNDLFYDFDSVDRKEYRSSPKARDLIPGQAEWEDAEVDKFYDGWVEDHIENSGGKIIGSNTEKTMNLNDGEHSHSPVYPTESGYEKLLESRHEFNDDYTKAYASKKKEIMISESALKTLRTIYAEKDDIDCPDCKKKLENKTIEISKPVNPFPKGKDKKDNRLIGEDDNEYKLDPVSKEVFYSEGHDIGELQPKFKREKVTIKN